MNEFCSDMLICGADEKILRILEPIPHFINHFNALTESELRMNVDPNEED